MNLAGKLDDYFNNYLCFERGVSDCTLRSYSTTLLLLINHICSKKKISMSKARLDMITRQNVLDFLRSQQEDKQLSISTCNQRLAAIKSFARYMASEDVLHLRQWNEIQKISKKRAPKHIPTYLSIEGISLLLSVIPQSTRKGRRDLALFSLMYETGARVQEIIDLTPSSMHISSIPYEVKIHGKGNKTRLCQLSHNVRNIVINYMKENKLGLAKNSMRPLFFNNRGLKLTNSGVAYILTEYAEQARKSNPELIPHKITPHALRHTRAMNLLARGMNLIYIRDILGHASVKTTEMYARIDSRSKQEALKKAHINVVPALLQTHVEEDDEITKLLTSIGK